MEYFIVASEFAGGREILQMKASFLDTRRPSHYHHNREALAKSGVFEAVEAVGILGRNTFAVILFMVLDYA